MDLNNDGNIIFDEFADYCIKKSLNIHTPSIMVNFLYLEKK